MLPWDVACTYVFTYDPIICCRCLVSVAPFLTIRSSVEADERRVSVWKHDEWTFGATTISDVSETLHQGAR